AINIATCLPIARHSQYVQAFSGFITSMKLINGNLVFKHGAGNRRPTFDEDAEKVRLADFRFRLHERYFYEADAAPTWGRLLDLFQSPGPDIIDVTIGRNPLRNERALANAPRVVNHACSRILER